eukprot:Rhum_TRINITY_DN15114_c3_g2::Rhum_TRINITY_DN15114_c3_g2_i4::g.138615::m.138615
MAVALTEVAKSNSVHEALEHYLTEEEVRSWLAFRSLPGKSKRKQMQKQWGVTADESLDPLTLRYWCEVWSHETWEDFNKDEKILPVACYLREAYIADTKV